jgi:uncharacterized protein (TIGR03435 family)
MISERFDISAKLPEGASEDQIPEMLQALLADRFKLAVHRETKEQPGYALTVAKSGLKIKEASPEDAPAAPVPVDPSATFNSVVPLGRSQVRITENPGGHGGTITGPSTGTVRELAGANGAVRLEALSISSGGLTDLLTMLLRQPVMDMTELKGRYQLVLEINVNDMVKDAQERGQQAQVPFDPSVPIIAAVQKLGLKLEQRKMPVETIVVDHLEKTPTEN